MPLGLLAVGAEPYVWLPVALGVAGGIGWRQVQIRESTRAHQRAILDSLHDGIVIQRADGAIIGHNPNAELILGLTADQLLGRSSIDSRWRCILEDGSPFPGELHPAMVTLRTGEPVIDQVMGVHRPDGSLVWLEVCSKLIGGGGPRRSVTSFRDVTAQRMDIQQNRVMAQSAFDGILAIDQQGLIRMVNPAAERLFGYGAAQLVGSHFSRLVPESHVDAISGDLRLAVAGDAQVSGKGREVLGLRADGCPFPLALGVAETRLGDERLFVATVRDLTAQNAAQAALRSLSTVQQGILDAANFSIIATDRIGVIQVWNRSAERMLGYRPEEMIGRSTPAPLHEPAEVVARAAELSAELGIQIEPGFDAFVARSRLLGEADEREWTYIRKDGSRFPVLLSVTCLRDQAGVLTGYLGIAADITERKNQEVELIAARDRAEAGARAKSNFLATMSHEIRTPMNGVVGMADLLLGTALDRQQRDYLDTIRSCSDSLLVLINDILDFSKIESGSLQLESIPFDPRQVAEEAVLVVAERAQAKGVELVCQIEDQMPDSVDGDPSRLRQILVNLLSNAVKFTAAGEIILTLGFDGKGLHFTVQDTGIGISSEVIPKLFQAFTQADASTTRRFGGTGLGLAICRRLAELMGGTLQVESQLGSGSTFALTMPIETSISISTQARFLQGKRVLVLDRHLLAGTAVARILQAAGAEVDVCVTSQEAEHALSLSRGPAGPYSLVVADRESGGLALAKLLAGAAAPPRVVLTATLGEQVPEAELASHALAACLSKPVRRSSLLRGCAEGGGSTTTMQSVVVMSKAMHVLVAEDNLVNQRVVTALLSKLGVTCEVAGNGHQALAALARGSYQLVLMDCQMPEMDGYTATSTWRSRELAGHRLPIIALTANALPGDRELCLASGMDDHLPKPVRLDALSEVLRRWGHHL